MELAFHTRIAGAGLSVAEAGMTRIESHSRAIDWVSDQREASVRRTETAVRATGVELYAVHAPFGKEVGWC